MYLIDPIGSYYYCINDRSMIRLPSGRLYNWKTVKNVMDSIDSYIGSHGAAVLYTAKRYNIAVSTIYGWLKVGHDGTEKSTRNGANNVIMRPPHIDFLIYYLTNTDCQLYVSEMSDLIFKEYGELYEEHVIRNALKARNFTHKLIEQIAGEQDNESRNAWIEMVGISK